MRCFAAGLVLSFAFAAGCSREPEARTYTLTGQILAVRPDTRELLVRHEDIPGFMPAMTMAYAVKDVALLKDRAAGDLITATLKVGTDAAWLSTVTKTGAAPLPEHAPSKIPAAAGVHVLQPGDVAPETSLIDQDLAQLSLTQWRGFAVAVTFIYTSCPLPQFCPMLDRRFSEVQTLVAADSTLRGRVRLLSVSFDPAVDQPPQLKAHATTLGADPAVWRFATAPEDVVERFAAEFGVNVIHEADGTITHNMRTAVIDTRGRIVSVLDNSTWTAAALAADLARAAAVR